MAACEVCWERATLEAQLLGGSVVDHYERRVREIDDELTTGEKASPEDYREPLGVSPIEHLVKFPEK